MPIDFAKLHIASREDGEWFFPWAMLMASGAPWAFSVPSVEDRERLLRLARRYYYASWASLALGLCIGISLGHGKLALLLSIVLPLACYSAVVMLRVRHLRRLPVVECLRCYHAKVGRESLWRGVFLAAWVLVFVIGLRITSFLVFVCTGYFILNATMASAALWIGRS